MNVSIAVICFNAEKTIEQTLNSILSQSYPLDKIEIVISDDFSQDNTRKIVDHWVDKNGCLFSNVQLNYNIENRGVTANCQIAWSMCNSSWIKSIAGDDKLANSCVDEFVNYTKNNPDAKFIFSMVQTFNEQSEFIDILPKKYLNFFSLTPENQFKYLCFGNVILAPTFFFNKDSLSRAKVDISTYSFMEDYPMWLILTSVGFKLHFIPKPLVLYRVSESVSNRVNTIINKNLQSDAYKIHKNIILPRLKQMSYSRWLISVINFNITRLHDYLAINLFGNKKNFVSKVCMMTIKFFSFIPLLRFYRKNFDR